MISLIKNRKDTHQKFGRLAGVNLEIRAFATDPQKAIVRGQARAFKKRMRWMKYS